MHPRRFMPDTYELDPQPDFAEFAAWGGAIVALKCSEGAGHIDAKHEERTRLAREQGLTVVHYHYCRPNEGASVELEATNLHNSLRGLWVPGDHLALDFEAPSPSGIAASARYIEQLHGAVQALLAHDADVYGSTSFLREYTRPGWLRKRRVWVAQWDDLPIDLPGARRPWARQTSNGIVGPFPHTVPGFAGCDVSVVSARSAFVYSRRAARRRRMLKRKRG